MYLYPHILHYILLHFVILDEKKKNRAFYDALNLIGNQLMKAKVFVNNLEQVNESSMKLEKIAVRFN